MFPGLGLHMGIGGPSYLPLPPWPHRWPREIHHEIVKLLVFNRARRLVGLPPSLEWRRP